MEPIKSASLITAVKTPYAFNGEIDLGAYDQLVEQLCRKGVQGIIVGGTTGEGHLLSWEEHLMLIAHSVHRFGKQLLIIGNTGSNSTREAIRATEYGFASGMHAALQINPYYGKTSPDGLKSHFQKLLDIGPGIIYNVPSRTGQDLEPHLIEKWAEHRHFIGVKECAGNARIAYYESHGIACWSGNDDQSFAGRHQSKSHGVISVAANLVPGLMRRLMDDPNSGDLNQTLQPLMAWLFCVPNPIPINTVLAMTGMASPVFRLPYVPLNREVRKKGLEILKTLDASEVMGSQRQVLEDHQFVMIE